MSFFTLRTTCWYGVVRFFCLTDLVQSIKRPFTRLETSTGTVTEGISRIEKVVRQLRIDRPEGNVGMQPNDVVATLESAWRIFSPTLAMPVVLTEEFAARPLIDCCVADIQQVFMALLSNAAHALEDARHHHGDGHESRITLSSACIDDHLVITISDNGIGIPEDTIEKIFDPFFTTKAVGRGAGLGLSMARDIIKKHQATLVARSTPGEGSSFTLRLRTSQPV